MSDQWIQEGSVHESCRKCGRNHKLGECTPTPTEPTLTYSEVVERLHLECMPWGWAGLFNKTKAENILHSWRERRVQELERAVKIASCQLAQGVNMDFSDANIERWQEEAQRIEQQLLIEAREDLAKGGGSHGE